MEYSRHLVNKRALSFVIIAASLIFSYVMFRHSTWIGNHYSYAQMGIVAAMLALFIGVVALLFYYVKKNSSVLVLGAGFLGTACLDGWYALDSTPKIDSNWLVARFVLSVCMLLSWFVWQSEERWNNKVRGDAIAVYFGVAILTSLSMALFTLIPWLRVYHPNSFWGKLTGYIPAVFFCLALIGYLRKGQWRTNDLDHWIVISLIIGLMSQVMFMIFLNKPYDGVFVSGYILKNVSYLCVLIGLLSAMYVTVKQALAVKEKLRAANDHLNDQIRFKDQALSLNENRAEKLKGQQEAMLNILEDAELARQEAEEAQERIRLIVEASPTGLMTVDRFGKITMVNGRVEKLFGYERDILLNQSLEILIPQRYRKQHIHFRSEYTQQPVSRNMGVGRDLYGLKENGEEFPIEIGLNPIQIKGESYILVAMTDITERKKSENEIKRSNQELEQFAYIASHDLQEPIRKIVGFIELFEKSIDVKIDGKSKEYMNYVIDGAKRMQNLIQDLLQYSRVGNAEISLEEIDMNEVIQEVRTIFELTIRETNASIHYDGLPGITAHRNFMIHILQNLMGNSLKYRSDLAPIIHISVKKVHDQWEFTFSDNGIGIDQKYAERIFVIFQRLHGKGQYSGTGIGLAICRRMIERQGGRIWLDQPKNDKGSVFKFTLPIRKITNKEMSNV